MPAADDREESRMLAFLDREGHPVALRPGHTWVIVVTPESELMDHGKGVWRLRYVPADREAR